MGKKNKPQKQQQQTQHIHSATCAHDHNHDHSGHRPEPEIEEVHDPGRLLSPEEKAGQYKEMQLSVFTNFIKDFEQEEAALMKESNDSLEKTRDIEKREREEIKRLEKTVFKKDS